ncbi:MAG: DUF2179 domain-containing protein [Candidatus Hermodarchaeota archaeon]
MSLFIELFGNPIFSLIILPFLIFFSRVADVTLGTLRIVFISQGRRKLAPVVGFFEIFIWLLAMGQIFSNLTNFLYYFAYASGFAIGNYVGLLVENKISLGLLSLRLILSGDPEKLVIKLKEQGYGITSVTAEGSRGNVKILIMIIKRKNQEKALEIIRNLVPDAFISIEQVQAVKGGKFPSETKTKWELLKRKKIK